MADQTNVLDKGTTPVNDDFASTFAELAGDDTPTIKKEDDVVLDGADALAAEKAPLAIDIEGALPDPKTVAASTPEVPEAPAAPSAADKAAADTALLERFRDLVKDPTPVQQQPAPQPEPREQPSAITPYSPEQKSLVDAYMKEWPDVYQAEQLIRAREYQALTQHIFNELAPILNGLQGQTQQIATATHVEQLHAAIPDYDEVAPKVVAWVETQPAYLKAAFEQVVKQGTVADVTDLVGRYRAASGEAAPTPVAPVAETPTPPAAQPTKLAQVVKGLAPVSTKRSGIEQGAVASDDFDGAFSAFAKAS